MPVKEIMCKIEEATPMIEKFFSGDSDLISLYLSVQEEMWRCDPDLLFCCKNGLIGLAKKEEKYRFFIAPAEDSYDIKFAHMEGKMPFRSADQNLYIKECEKCILRTEFQRDFDRLIFSAAFRRMQNKTQVFPLPGSVFVHNRLTHSLEVSSVGRSLGADVPRVGRDRDSRDWRHRFGRLSGPRYG